MALVLYLLVRFMRGRLYVRLMMLVVAGLSAVLSLESIIRSRAWIAAANSAGFPDPSVLKGTTASVLGGPVNEWATIILLGMTFQLASLRRASRPVSGPNLLLLGSFGFTFASLLFTFSRGAYLAAAILLVGAAISLKSSSFGPRARGLTIGLTVISVLVVVLVDSFSGHGVARTARLHLTEQQRRSSAGRLAVWSGALNMVPEHIITGSGPGSFAMRYVPYAALETGRPFVGRALNTPLNILIEEGLLGLALYGLIATAVACNAFGAIWRHRDGRGYPIIVISLGFSALCLKEISFSSFLENPLISDLSFVLIAVLTNISQLPRSRGAQASSRLCPIIAIVVAVFGANMARIYQNHKSAESLSILAAQGCRAGDYNRAATLVNEAIRKDASAYHYSLRALSVGAQYIPRFNPYNPVRTVQTETERQRLIEALRDYDRAIAGSPEDDLFWHNRAWLKVALGADLDEITSDLHRAIGIDGAERGYRIGLGLIYEHRGLAEQASVQYAVALAVAPDIADSEFARDLKARNAELWSECLARAAEILHARDSGSTDITVLARLGRIYWELGERERAQRAVLHAVQAMPHLPRTWSNLARIRMASGDLAGAAEALHKAAFLDPRDPIVLSLMAHVAFRTGNEREGRALSDASKRLAREPVSGHARRTRRIYMTKAVVDDDILPVGLLSYCSPSASTF